MIYNHISLFNLFRKTLERNHLKETLLDPASQSSNMSYTSDNTKRLKVKVIQCLLVFEVSLHGDPMGMTSMS